jgi:hypothetical protein
MRSNGLPSGHADLNGGHPGLKENLVERILITEVPSTPLRPDLVEEKATEDIQGLSGVGEVAGVIREKPEGVIFTFGGGLPEKDERPGDGGVARRFPFVPDFLVSSPSVMRHGALEQAVLKRFFGS